MVLRVVGIRLHQRRLARFGIDLADGIDRRTGVEVRRLGVAAHGIPRQLRGKLVVPGRNPLREAHEVHVVVRRTLRLSIGQRDVRSDVHVLAQLRIEARAHVETVVEVLLHQTVVQHEAARHRITQARPPARDAELGVGRHRAVAQSQPLPVGGAQLALEPGRRQVVHRNRGSAPLLLLLEDAHVIAVRHHRMQFIGLLEARVDRDVVAGLHGRALLGRDDDDTVRRTRSVDGGRRSILQHLDRGDVLRIDQLQSVLHDEVVDDNQRRAARIEGAAAAHADLGSHTHLGGGVLDRHTRQTSLQDGRDVRRGDVDDILRIEFRDSAGQVRLALYAVADHHQLLDLDRRLGELRVDARLASDGELERLVPHERKYQYGVRTRNLDPVGAVRIGRRADR